jgi:hypothetical protein
MPTRLQVLQSEIKDSQKGKKFQVLKCVIHFDNGAVDVGEVMFYGELGAAAVPPGEYIPSYDLRVGFGDSKGRIAPVIVKLDPVRASSKVPA